MQNFFIALLTIVVTIYTSTLAYSLYKDGNKPAMFATVCMVAIMIAAPFLMFRF